MCGIVGISGDFSKHSLEAAVALLKHRGPDDDGIYIDKKNHLGLGHTRLSIIELSPLGHQPMFSHDGNVVLVFNGEIYNFQNLRLDLESKGYSFNGNSDTEVILNMYLEYGINCLHMLNGIFSLAIFDHSLNELFVVRDGLGVKPIYYFYDKSSFIFASEIKALLPMLTEQLKVDNSSLYKYMTYLWCPGEGTLASSIRKVLPGEYVVVKNGEIIKHQNWFKLPEAKPLVKQSAKNIVPQLQRRLSDAVTRQMVADVPVGAFLSGGLDSSAIVAFAKTHSENIQCFSIDPEGGSDSSVAEDLPFAKRVAKHLKVDLEIVKIDPERLAKDLKQMVWQLDEPLADPAPLNVLYISRLAKEQGVKVLLSGSGGDDLFTGYRRHLAIRYEKYWAWLPSFSRKALENLSLKTNQNSSYGRRLSKLFNNAGSSGNKRLVSYFEWARRDDLIPLFSEKVKRDILLEKSEQPMLDYLNSINYNTHPIDKMLALEQRFFLPDHNLIYIDKMSMAAGVEVRVPFLDNDLVEFAATIPNKYKQRGTIGKWILKKAMEPYLPNDVIYRPKTGFGAPLRRWIKNDLRDMVGEILSKEHIETRGLFEYEKIQKLINDNDCGRRDSAYTIFSLLCIEIWCQKFIDRIPNTF